MEFAHEVKVRQLIAKQRYEQAAESVERVLRRHPEDADAHALGARILRERGIARDYEQSLVQWADLKPKAGAPVESLRQYYRDNQRWPALAALTGRARVVEEPARRRLLRNLVDDLAAGGRTDDLAEPLGVLLETSDAEAFSSALQAVVAASGLQLPRMLHAYASIRDSQDHAALLEELGLILSRRSAGSVRGVAVAGKPGTVELPPTGGHDVEDVAKAPVLARRVAPDYPEIARRARIEGLVRLRATVLASGRTIVTGTIEASNPLFMEPAVAAVSSWRYEPGRIADRAVAVDLEITVAFRLR
jgi:protein TonB